MKFQLVAALSAVLCALTAAAPRADPKECEVCVNVLEQISESMPAADRKNKDKIEAAIDAFCDQRLSSRDDKMCYYFLPIKKTISH
ncbi:unnamed protein product, partial [Ectocarpus sp. 12 AP-2014]